MRYEGQAFKDLDLDIVKKGIPTSMRVRFGTEGMEIESTVPSQGDIAALAHRLRPLILHRERTSFNNVAALLKRRFRHPYVFEVTDYQRSLFSGEQNQQVMRITSRGTLINSEETLALWLNGHEYHNDEDKRAKLDALHQVVPLEHSLPIFIQLLDDKVKAVSQLAELVSVILGQKDIGWISRLGKPLSE